MATDAPHAHTRGLLLQTVANAIFVVSGYVLAVALARILGAGGYGEYLLAAGVVTVLNMAGGRGVPQVVSRAIGAHPDAAALIARQGWRVSLSTATVLTIVFAFGAYPLALAFGDEALTDALRIASITAIAFSVNGMLVGIAGGLHHFGRQATAQAAYGVVRVATIVGGAALWGLEGAMVGFVIAPLLAGLPAYSRLGTATAEPPSVSNRAIVTAAVPLVVTASTVILLMVVDMIALARVSGDALVGAYGAAGTLAHVPYFLLQATALVVLPSIARVANDNAALRQRVASAMTDTVVLLAAPSAILAVIGGDLVVPIFGDEFSAGSELVMPLALATIGITMYAALTAVDAALHRLRIALTIGALGLVAIAVGVTVAAENYSVLAATWIVCAICTAMMVAHGVFVWRRIGSLLQWRRATIAVVIAAVCAAPLSLVDSTNVLVLVGAGAVAGIAALVASVATGALRVAALKG